MNETGCCWPGHTVPCCVSWKAPHIWESSIKLSICLEKNMQLQLYNWLELECSPGTPRAGSEATLGYAIGWRAWEGEREVLAHPFPRQPLNTATGPGPVPMRLPAEWPAQCHGSGPATCEMQVVGTFGKCGGIYTPFPSSFSHCFDFPQHSWRGAEPPDSWVQCG